MKGNSRHTGPLRAARRACLASALALALAGTAWAQAGSAIADYDVPAGELARAVNGISQQSGVQVVYDIELLRGKRVGAVKGRLSLRQALDRALAGTGLTYAFVNDNTVIVKQGEPAPAADARPAPKPRATPASQGDEAVKNMPAIMVTGTRTLNVDIERTRDDIQPYVVFDRETIERSGATNLEDFFKKKLTMSVGAISQSQIITAPLGNTSSINLRGLGSDETLILVDGRRAAGITIYGGSGQPDINGIPLSAIERIEVLPTTASGIYGGGATGGAINIVLRRDYSGVESQISYSNTFDTDVAARRIDINAGWSLNEARTNILAAASISDSNVLLTADRDFTQRGRDRILRNNPAFFYGGLPLGATTNIRSADGTNLILKDGSTLGSPITWIPYGYPGISVDSGEALIQNSGSFNLDLPKTGQTQGERRALLNNPKTRSIMLTLRHDINPMAQLFVDLNVSSNKGYAQQSPLNISGTIGASSPRNPFMQDIRISAPAVGIEDVMTSEARSRRVATGAIFKFTNNWQGTVEASVHESKFSYDFPKRSAPELASAVSNGELDVLRDHNEYPLDLSSYIGPSVQSQATKTTLKNIATRFAGPLPWPLPGGRPTLTALLEYRKEELGESVIVSSGRPVAAYPEQSQEVGSIYLETIFPLISNKNKKPLAQSLEVQLAVRYDDYQINAAPEINPNNPMPFVRTVTNQSSIDPTIGIRYQPAQSMVLRASYGTGYLPPSMRQLVPPPSVEYALGEFPFNLTDPLRGNEPLGLTVLNYNTGELRPERSESLSAGMVLTPAIVPGLRISTDWMRIKKEDNISRIWDYDQSVLELESIVPGFITRAPALAGDPYGVGPIVEIGAGLFNISNLTVEAVDLALDYGFDTNQADSLDLSFVATRLIHLESKLTPTSPLTENAGVANSFTNGDGGGLKWKANASLTWRSGAWTLGWAVNYFDGYFLNISHTIDQNQGSSRIPSQTYHDVFGRYEFGAAGSSLLHQWLSGVELRFGVNNIFNRKPPIDVSSSSLLYYSPWGDPRMANYYISMKKSFGN